MLRKNKQLLAAGSLLCVLLTQGFAAPVRSAAEPDYPPLSVVNSDGKADGFSVELLRAALAEMGMEVSFQTGAWSEIKTDLAEGRLEVLPLIGRTPERRAQFDFTIPYLTVPGALFVRNDNTEIRSPADLQGLRIAVMQSDNAEEYVRRARLSETVIVTTNFAEAFQMLSDGRADAVIAQKLMGVSLLQQMGLTNIRVTGNPIERFQQEFCFAVKKGNGKLLSALNKGLSIVMIKGTYRQLERKWLYVSEDAAVHSRMLVYSDNFASPPHSFLDEQGQPTGFNVELLRAIARKTGLNISFQLDQWEAVWDQMQKGTIDITSMQYPNPEKEVWVDFSIPHSTVYRAVFARRDSPPYKTPEDLKGRRIAFPKLSVVLGAYALQQGLEPLTTTETLEAAMDLLDKGQVDFALCSLSTGRYWIRQNERKNLYAVDPRLQKSDFCYAVRKGDTALLDLLNDGLTQLKESGEYQQIYNQWLGVLEPEAHWPQIRKILLIAGAAIALLTAVAALLIALLKQQVKKRTLEIKSANQALKESRQAALNLMEDAVLAKERLELTQFAIDRAGDPAFWISSTGQFAYVNEAACLALGYDKEELLQLSVPDIDPDMPAERWLAHWKELQEKRSLQFEMHHKTKDGRVFPVELYTSYIKYGDKEYICAFAHDITNRKESEKRLRFEQNLFLSFMEFLPANVYFKDTAGRLVYVNQRTAIYRGMAKEALIGKTDFDFFPEAQAQKKSEDEQQVMQTGQPIEIEELSGSVWHLTVKAPRYDDNGNLSGTFGISWDITSRKQFAEALQTSEARYRLLFENMTSGFALHEMMYDKQGNPNDYRWLQVNPAFEKLTGLSAEKVVGHTAREILPDIEDDWIETFGKVAKNGESIVFENYSKDLEKYFETRVFRPAPGQFAVIFADVTERIIAQQNLEESRQFLRTVIDSIPTRVFWKDRNSTYLGCNLPFAQDAGFATPEEVAGKTDFDMLWTDDQSKAFRADDREVIESGAPKLDIEEPQTRSNGALNWLKTSKIPLKNIRGEIVGVIGAYEDITERKRMRQAIEKRIIALTRPLDESGGVTFDDLFDLKEIQRIQDEFAAATGVASVITSPNGTPITRPSHFTHLCKDIIRKTEKGCANCFKSDAALGRNHPGGPIVQPCLSGGLWDAGVSITVGDQHIANWLIGQVRDEAQTDEQMRAYAREIGADEKTFMDAFYNVPVMSLEHFEQIAQALFTLANQLSTSAYQNIQQARFIAEEKKNQAELLRLSTAIEQSPEAVVITNPDGTIQYVNPAFATITGYSCEEALGKNPRILKSGNHDAAFYSNLWKTITSGKIWESRFVNKRKNGELYTEEASISPVRDPSGTITGYVAVKRDITHELAQEEKFRQSQKMDAIGQLTGGIAHDFNNVLQAILGFSELLLNQLQKDSLEHQNAGEVQKAARRAADMIRQLLAFSRKQPVDRKRIDLNAVVRDIEVLLQLLLGNKTEIAFVTQPDLHAIYADHSQLTQIIINLSVNARDAMPDGGRLTITTENITFAPQDVAGIPEAEPGSFVCLSAADTGCGMSPEVKNHLFEPFFTTKAVGQGTGMGLSVVYGIVKQNKGWIHVDSEEGRGSTLKIYLPACETPAINNPADRTPNARILLVEDDEGMRNMVIQILESAGYKPVVAASAEEALDLFKQQKGDFDMLFSDIVMPGKDGIELADLLRKEKPGLPVLLYSGYQDQHERWVHLGSKGYHFLQKPVSVAGLLTAVYGALAEVSQ